MSIATHKGTYVKLTDLNISADKFKVKYQHDRVKILYNYFNDFWEELCIDTWFEKIHQLNDGFGKAHITFTEETRLMKKMTAIMEIIKKKLDDDGIYLPTNDEASMLGKQKIPKFCVCKNTANKKLNITNTNL